MDNIRNVRRSNISNRRRRLNSNITRRFLVIFTFQHRGYACCRSCTRVCIGCGRTPICQKFRPHCVVFDCHDYFFPRLTGASTFEDFRPTDRFVSSKVAFPVSTKRFASFESIKTVVPFSKDRLSNSTFSRICIFMTSRSCFSRIRRNVFRRDPLQSNRVQYHRERPKTLPLQLLHF